jgi:hypothetical protein
LLVMLETKQQFKAEGEDRELMSVVRVGVASSEVRDLTIANNLWWEVIEGLKVVLSIWVSTCTCHAYRRG